MTGIGNKPTINCAPASWCSHVDTVGNYTKLDILNKQKLSACDTCLVKGPNVWACLHSNCLYLGCGETVKDHSTLHFEGDNTHCLTLNLTTLRLWCYQCQCEVLLNGNVPPLPDELRKLQVSGKGLPPSPDTAAERIQDENSESDEDSANIRPRGLTGLQNIGNTCYMNAALQALSNCQPLTQFFLHCRGFVRSDRRPCLSRSYLKLMDDIWHRSRLPYVVPRGISYEIKLVCPVFKGYTQQDSQEFLRCFLDQIHEELKWTQQDFSDSNLLASPTGGKLSNKMATNNDHCIMMSETDSVRDSGIHSFSGNDGDDKSEADKDMSDDDITDYDYETCDSGPNSEKSSCSEELDGNLKSSVRKNGGMGGSRQTLAGGVDTVPLLRGHTRHASLTIPGPGSRGDVEAGDAHITSPSFNKHFELSMNESQANSEDRVRPQKQPNASRHGKKRREMKYRSIISDVFDGKLLSSVQCLTCDRVSSTRETFQDLSLPIPNREYVNVLHAQQPGGSGGPQGAGSSRAVCTDVYLHHGWISWIINWMKSWFWGPTVTLNDCLAAFFSADELKGDNMYSCDKCKKLRNGVKYSKVLELPEVLCVHLKRFRHELNFSTKICSFVSFPLTALDMKPFLHRDCPIQVTSYDLVAVICHHGTAGGGHYTSFGLNCNGCWYEYDDQYVTQVDEQMVANCEAYVLFYRKTSPDMEKHRRNAMSLAEGSAKDSGLMQFYISKQWLNRFYTFAEPGPVDNTDFLCQHGCVQPEKANYAGDLYTMVSQPVWEYFRDNFGGGPACSHLYVCPGCQQELVKLDQRKKEELDTFVLLNHKFRVSTGDCAIYVISMNWFRTWQNFVKTDEKEAPGPIDNNNISIKNAQGAPKLRMGSDYAEVSEEVWLFFLSIYGGGPEFKRRQGTVSPITTNSLNRTHARSPTISTAAHNVTPTPTSNRIRSYSAAGSCSYRNSPIDTDNDTPVQNMTEGGDAVSITGN